MARKYVPGDYKVIDDYSGFTRMRSECRFTWDGYLVAEDEWEEKHPQLILYPRTDDQSIRDARPESEDDNDLKFGEGDRDSL